jgi:hypothetical protein
MRSLDLPIEVRKLNLAIVARSVISQPVDVPPGTYYISVKMPAGQELFKEVKVGRRAQNVVKVTLAPDPEDEPPSKSQELLHFLQKSAVRAFPVNQLETPDLLQPVVGKLRAFSGNLLRGECHDMNRDSWELRSLGTDDLAQLDINGTDAVQLLQLIQPGQPVLNIVLPVSSKSGCIVVLKRFPDRSTGVNIHLNNSMANLLWQYTERGYIQQALTTVTSDTLQQEKLLEGETSDPIAAAVRAYTILRFGELEELDDWTEALKNQFTWLPDGLAIRGEHLARLGEHEQALTVFLEMPTRGLPIFSDGFSYVIDRLRLYISVGESHFEATQLCQARELFECLQRFATFVDFTKPMLAFTGVDPLTPNVQSLKAEEMESIKGKKLAWEQRGFQLQKQKLEEQQSQQSSSMSLEIEFFREMIERRLQQEIHIERLRLIVDAAISSLELGKSSEVKHYEVTLLQEQKLEQEKLEYQTFFENLESSLKKSNNFLPYIKKIQEFISRTKDKLEKSQEKRTSEDENRELENHIALLEDELSNLRNIEQRLQSSKVALDWLDPSTKKEFLADLAIETAEAALETSPGLINPATPEGIIDFTRFRLDIKDFLFLIHGCLLTGKPDLLDWALAENKLPNPRCPLPTTAYAAAFIFIRDQKVDRTEQGISGKPAEELKTYLNYLIDKLNSTT